MNNVLIRKTAQELGFTRTSIHTNYTGRSPPNLPTPWGELFWGD